MWHVSISWQHQLTCRWPAAERKRIQRWAAHLLEGVGASQSHAEWGQTCYHWRKPLSPSELAGLDPCWLAAPAIDGA